MVVPPTMGLSVGRTLRERFVFFARAALLASAGVFVLQKVFLPRAADELVMLIPTLLLGLVSGWAADRLAEASIHELRVARLGTAEERRAVLDGRAPAADPARHRRWTEALLAWRSSSGGLVGTELERYRACVLASACEGASSTQSAVVDRLLESTDTEVRGYAAWLAVGDGMELAPETLSAGAALARHHGRDELASVLDLHAVRVLGRRDATPYR
jgi:hypothetical protein